VTESAAAAVQVLFFASLKEAVGREGLRVPVSEPVSIDGFLDRLATELPLEAMIALRAENVRLAINQNIATGSHTIEPGDEVAFLPPVTGG